MKKIMVAPLNWGLGHATRCIPIVRALEQANVTVLLAADGEALTLLKQEFPQLPTYALPAYNIRYAKSGGFRLAFKLIFQLPTILKAIILEYFWLKNFLKTNDIDIIISDNRFGFFTRTKKCIFLTHQLNIQTPFRWSTIFVNWVNHFFLKQFDEIWIPDFEQSPNLSGLLSHGNFPKSIKSKLRYLTPLSRFKYLPLQIPIFDLAIVLSGVEPQRTLFENKILEQLKLNFQKFNQKNYKILFVRGSLSKNNKVIENTFDNIHFHHLATAQQLNEWLSASRGVLCRAGYSTIMDLAVLGSRAVLVPTPGQTEQEYLAQHLAATHFFTFQTQNDLDLSPFFQENKLLEGIPTILSPDISVLNRLIQTLLQ